jgi:hypothetical protein
MLADTAYNPQIRYGAAVINFIVFHLQGLWSSMLPTWYTPQHNTICKNRLCCTKLGTYYTILEVMCMPHINLLQHTDYIFGIPSNVAIPMNHAEQRSSART